jgi:hypothetical protein
MVGRRHNLLGIQNRAIQNAQNKDAQIQGQQLMRSHEIGRNDKDLVKENVRQEEQQNGEEFNLYNPRMVDGRQII